MTIKELKALLVAEHQQIEEQLLRRLDWLAAGSTVDGVTIDVDMRWLEEGRRLLELAMMAINRAVLMPSRVEIVGGREG